MKWTVGAKIGAGFAFVVAIFAAGSVVSYVSTTESFEIADARQDTYDILSRLAEIELLAVEMQNGVRGYAITGDEAQLEPYQKALDRTEAVMREARQLVENNPRQRQRFEEFDAIVKDRVDRGRKTMATIRQKGPEGALELVRNAKGGGATASLRKALDQVEGEERRVLKERSEAAQAYATRTKVTIVGGTLVAIALSALIALFIARNISGPLRELTVVADKITAGDLSAELHAGSRSDEVGSLARAFDRMSQSLRRMAGVANAIAAGNLRTTIEPQSPNDALGNAFKQMSDNLRAQIRDLVEGANTLGSASSEIVASTSEFAATASQAAAAVSQTSTTVEEVRQTAQLSAQKARYVADSAQQAAQSSKSGGKSTEEAAAGMQRISEQMEAIAASMTRLSEQGHAIGQIIATVEDLAAQSNLLAVNAAIEAAKAGEHGKGFGVVAQEVKSLAEQSRQATNQVRTILGDIQKAAAASVMATEQGGKAVAAGLSQATLAGDAIQALAVNVNEAAQAATQIAASSQQQLVGVDQVAAAMDSIKRASAQNVASATQLENAARNLNDLGQRMKQTIARYEV